MEYQSRVMFAVGSNCKVGFRPETLKIIVQVEDSSTRIWPVPMLQRLHPSTVTWELIWTESIVLVVFEMLKETVRSVCSRIELFVTFVTI